MDPAKLPLQAYTSRRSGYRANGRPRKRWTDNIADNKKTWNDHDMQHKRPETENYNSPRRCTADVDKIRPGTALKTKNFFADRRKDQIMIPPGMTDIAIKKLFKDHLPIRTTSVRFGCLHKMSFQLVT
ncbi:hypothetical protein BsWGS_01079 [Bradybaena similaris]